MANNIDDIQDLTVDELRLRLVEAAKVLEDLQGHLDNPWTRQG